MAESGLPLAAHLSRRRDPDPRREPGLDGFPDEEGKENDPYLDYSQDFSGPAQRQPYLEDGDPDYPGQDDWQMKFCSQNVSPHVRHYSSLSRTIM